MHQPQEHPSPLSDPRPAASAAAPPPGPSSHETGSSNLTPIEPKGDAAPDNAPVDSGVDVGSASDYDQENSGDHVIEAHNNFNGDGAFTDEGYDSLFFAYR